jgi:hypothetical protein
MGHSSTRTPEPMPNDTPAAQAQHDLPDAHLTNLVGVFQFVQVAGNGHVTERKLGG